MIAHIDVALAVLDSFLCGVAATLLGGQILIRRALARERPPRAAGPPCGRTPR
jgi:hypothetical protein